MSAAGLVGGILGIGGGAITGLGAAKQAAEMKALKKRIGWEIGNLNELANPIEKMLREGYRPGGALSRALTIRATSPAMTALALREQAARGKGVNFGGAGYGRAGDVARTAQLDRITGRVAGEQQGLSASDSALANMFLTLKGKESIYSPKAPVNKLEPWSELVRGLGEGTTAYDDYRMKHQTDEEDNSY